ncbi:unnamed protein product [Lota lota]
MKRLVKVPLYLGDQITRQANQYEESWNQRAPEHHRDSGVRPSSTRESKGCVWPEQTRGKGHLGTEREQEERFSHRASDA